MLKDTRVSLGLTLQEVANTARLSRFTIENAEKGKVISEVSAAKIVNALNILSGQTYTVESLGIQTKRDR